MKAKAKWLVLVVIVLTIGSLWYIESFGYPAVIRVSRAEDVVSAKLFDGDSAKFRNVRVVNTITVCGEVNAKNRLGAYIGFSGFSVTGNDADPIVSFDDSIVSIMCKNESRAK